MADIASTNIPGMPISLKTGPWGRSRERSRLASESDRKREGGPGARFTERERELSCTFQKWTLATRASIVSKHVAMRVYKNVWEVWTKEARRRQFQRLVFNYLGQGRR